ncbi:MAG: hypothetical protein LBU53_05350 [Zoogloeaceae bacterium]|jgi:hypothetical protein|nr:hypothetical protein [Zoogloeaceae bacterium]
MTHKFGHYMDVLMLTLAVGVMLYLLANSHYLYSCIYGTILVFAIFVPRLCVTYFRWKGIYPKSGSESVEHAVLLYKRGYKFLAMRCYRKASRSSLKETTAYFRGAGFENIKY